MSEPVGVPRADGSMSIENEQRYFDALKRITLYQSVERLRRRSSDEWGVDYPESLEMAYENVKADAERAIRGRRRPKVRDPQTNGPGAESSAGSDISDGAKLEGNPR